MQYNFDQAPERRGTDSAKWSYYAADVLPMWVADMDFASPPAIVEALQARVAQRHFGYGWDNARLRAAVVARLATRYGWEIAPEAIVFLPGLVSGLNVVSRAVGQPGDGVVVHTPVYGPFLSAPVNQGRKLQVAPMLEQITGQPGGRTVTYAVDYAAFEGVIDATSRLFILCNPHNPVGRAFTREELRRMADISLAHDLVICSDEIHCDLLMGETEHLPMAALGPEVAARTITLMAPSKTFNVPGLGFSMAIVPDAGLRKQVEAAGAGIVPHTNLLGVVAAEAAYTGCDEWLGQLNAYLTANRDFAVDFLQKELPGAAVTCPEATYLLWLDCRELPIEGTPSDFFLQRAKVAVNDGKWFGQGGEGFVRLNYGCPRATLAEGLEKMVEAIRHGE